MVRDQTRLILEVPTAGEGQRLDLWLTKQLPSHSRSSLQKLIAAALVARNDLPCKARDLLRAGDKLELTLPPAAPSHLEPVAMALAILYEDDDLVVINKAAGIAVHPGAGNHGPTLVHGLLHHAGTLSQPAAGGVAWQRPGIVHRLDKDTSGALVVAKTDVAHRHLAAQFQAKTNSRHYLALLDGYLLAKDLTYASYLSRDPRNRLRFTASPVEEVQARYQEAPMPKGLRWAKSVFHSEATYGERLSLAKVTLHTGRTHQIRVHAKALGCPVWGDPLYGVVRELPQTFPPALRAHLQGIKRQLLHAQGLGFDHPRDKRRLYFEAPLPEDFQRVLGLLAPYRTEAL